MRRQKISIFMLALTLCIMLGLVGCNSATSNTKSMPDQLVEDNSDNKNTDAQSEVAKMVDTSVSKTEMNTQPSDPVKDEKKDAGKSLKEILSGKLTKYTADYTLTTSQMSFTMNIASDLPKMAVTSIVKDVESKSIIDGEKIYACSKTDGKWQCFEQKIDTPEQDKIESEVKSGNAKSTYVGTCNVAGETGSEYEVISNEEKSQLCYTSDGIVLRMKTTLSDMTATKVVRSVASDAFKLPAEPQDMAALQAQYANMYKQ